MTLKWGFARVRNIRYLFNEYNTTLNVRSTNILCKLKSWRITRVTFQISIYEPNIEVGVVLVKSTLRLHFKPTEEMLKLKRNYTYNMNFQHPCVILLHLDTINYISWRIIPILINVFKQTYTDTYKSDGSTTDVQVRIIILISI